MAFDGHARLVDGPGRVEGGREAETEVFGDEAIDGGAFRGTVVVFFQRKMDVGGVLHRARSQRLIRHASSAGKDRVNHWLCQLARKGVLLAGVK